ncbi:MAG: hypothetical protein SFW09_15590 [Hyphomicrobiaceae bacterium]|nr:hypothetical protein [Hyphomicrobiaceae bacterium]
MRNMIGKATVAVLAAMLVSGAAAAQTCVDKGGRGTGSTIPDAKFQAWEAVLQATDWSMWFSWITTSSKVGAAASGYKVSNYREKCGNGGSMGKECIIRAKLCK